MLIHFGFYQFLFISASLNRGFYQFPFISASFNRGFYQILSLEFLYFFISRNSFFMYNHSRLFFFLRVIFSFFVASWFLRLSLFFSFFSCLFMLSFIFFLYYLFIYILILFPYSLSPVSFLNNPNVFFTSASLLSLLRLISYSLSNLPSRVNHSFKLTIIKLLLLLFYLLLCWHSDLNFSGNQINADQTKFITIISLINDLILTHCSSSLYLYLATTLSPLFHSLYFLYLFPSFSYLPFTKSFFFIHAVYNLFYHFFSAFPAFSLEAINLLILYMSPLSLQIDQLC